MTNSVMTSASYDFLCVDDFLQTEFDARAIRSAFETGLIDSLIANGSLSEAMLAAKIRMAPAGFRLLTGLLAVNNVIRREGDQVALTPAFVRALGFRDLLQTRMDFADLVWGDIHTLFTPLLADLPQFMARSKVFDLFRYDRCMNVTAENLEATKSWVRLTTGLTRYESQAVLDAVDLGAARSFLDIGGNSGELALQVCRRYPKLQATVVDLPVVCALGRSHVAAVARPQEAARIQFCAADFRRDPLPAAADIVAFKSVLHDWPDADAERLIERACARVNPGGGLLIFERGPIEIGDRRLPYSMAPNLVFLQFLRSPDLYLRKLAELGLTQIEHQRIALEMEFSLIVARRPG
jgi:SAM-dependent methyltransferase